MSKLPILGYSGGKALYKIKIKDLILKNIPDDFVPEYYVEPFFGMGSVMYEIINEEKFKNVKVQAGDISEDIICLHNHFFNVIKGTERQYTAEELECKNKEDYNKIISESLSARRVIIGLHYSFAGRMYRCFHKGKDKDGRRTLYETYLGMMKRYDVLSKKLELRLGDYKQFSELKNSVIYLDPPYKNTHCHFVKLYDRSISGRGVLKTFDSEKFFNWCREMKKRNNIIFLSERSAPEDFRQIGEWRQGKEKLYIL